MSTNKLRFLLHFITQIPGFFRLYDNYGYDPDVYDFIIDQYQKVLCNRTKTMSYPTYYANDVIGELDRFYDGCYEEEISRLKEEVSRLEKQLYKRDDDLM